MLDKFAFPSMKLYDGNTDPDNHIAHYKQRMFAVSIPRAQCEACMCKGFGSSLAGQLCNGTLVYQTHQLTLSLSFTPPFKSSLQVAGSRRSIRMIRQEAMESLRTFVARFNREKVSIPGCGTSTAISGLQTDSDLYKELTKYPCRTMKDVLNKAQTQIKWEEEEVNCLASTLNRRSAKSEIGYVAENEARRDRRVNGRDPRGNSSQIPYLTSSSVTIVGGGPSGLAVAACLCRLSIPYTLLEREDCYASIWQKYAYDRVHLHLAKQFCELPLMPFPASYPTYISRKQFVDYLNDYVSRFAIRPSYGRSVEAAERDDAAGEWTVKARNLDSGEVEEYRSRFLVVATGETCDASLPEIEGLGSFAGEVLHSTRYRNGREFAGKKVLVVGSGNSGMEIALDLSNCGAKTSVVVRSPIHILSRTMAYVALVLIKHLPLNWVDSMVITMSKFVYGDLSKFGIQRPKEGGPFALKVKYGKYPVIDVGTLDKIKSGEIQVLPGLTGVKGNNIVLFNNNQEHAFDVLIFATGFKRSTKQWLKGDDYLLNEDGLPKPEFPNHWKGKNGLYCAGLARRGLYGAAMDAQNIAHDIKAFFT